MRRKRPAAAVRTRLTSDERRTQLVAAARVVFTRHGLAGARTRDIAAEAGVTEGLVYQHFRSKEELFEAAIAAPLEEAVAALVEKSGRPPESFDASGEAMFERTRSYYEDILRAMDDVAPLLGVILFGDEERARRYYLDRVEPALQQVQAVVRSNLSAWSHREFDIELTVNATFGAIWFQATVSRLAGRKVDHAQVAHDLTTMMMDGLRLP